MTFALSYFPPVEWKILGERHILSSYGLCDIPQIEYVNSYILFNGQHIMPSHLQPHGRTVPINTAIVTSRKSDFCRRVASINHRKWAVLMLTTGTYWHVQLYMICTLQSSSPPLFPPPQQQIWYTGSKLCEFCMNKSFASTSLHFTWCLLLSFFSPVHLL